MYYQQNQNYQGTERSLIFLLPQKNGKKNGGSV